MNKNRELEDQLLFDNISKKYAKKDIYQVSKIARHFQVECLKNFMTKEYNIENSTKIIEVGCGHGANSLYLKGLYKEYLGIDYSHELIKIASDRYTNEDTTFFVDNIKHIGKYGEFDIVFGIGILHHVDDIKETLLELKKLGHSKTLYVFYEPQRGNPLIQLLRKIRMKIDNSFSSDQIFFEKQELTDIVSGLGFQNIKSRYNGYLTPPFAQVMLKPKFLFLPLSKLAIVIDRFLYKKVDSKLAWNFMIAFTK